MNLTGSVVTLSYFLLKKIGGDRLHKKTLYGFLCANILTFLVPLHLLGEFYKSIAILLPVDRSFSEQLLFTSRDLVVLETEEGAKIFSHGLRIERNLVFAYLAITVLMVAFWLFRDWWNQRGIRRAVAFGEIREDPILTKLRGDYGVRQKVECCACEDRTVAAILGIRRPVLFYKAPETRLEQELLISHELYHVKRRDVVWRVMADLVRGLHFWNPFVHLLWRELAVVCEQSCDEWVIQGRNNAQRSVYAKLLVDYSGPASSRAAGTLFAFGEAHVGKMNDRRDGGREAGDMMDVSSDDTMKGKVSCLERRIRLIIGYDEKKKIRRWVGNLLAGFLLFVCSLSTLAYEDVRFYPVQEEMKESWTNDTEVTVFAMRNLEEDEIRYPAQYQDEFGNIYPLTESEIAVQAVGGVWTFAVGTDTPDGRGGEARSGGSEADKIRLREDGTNGECTVHEFEDVVLTYHEADSKGGCTVKVMAARRCVRCGAVEDCVSERQSSYPFCGHSFQE